MSDKKHISKIQPHPVTLLIVALLLLLLAVACCHILRTQPQDVHITLPQETVVADGQEILRSLANGALLYSVQKGGNGETNFPSSTEELLPYIPPIIAQAIQSKTRNAVPCGGYIARIIAVPQDAYDFCFEVIPAQGYKGKTYRITRNMIIEEYPPINTFEPSTSNDHRTDELPVDSTLKPTQKASSSMGADYTVSQQEKSTVLSITTDSKTAKKDAFQNRFQKATQKISQWLSDKTPPQKENPADLSMPVPPKNANAKTAEKLLNSLSHAAVLFSVKNGGNGTMRFPVRISDIREYVPVAVWRSVVISDENKATPIDGYMTQMLPSKSGDDTDFCFIAFPAMNVRGDSFEIDKSGNISKISK